MRDLAKYSFANAKIRAMLSFLISPDVFDGMLGAADRDEALGLLAKTVYAPVIAGLSGDTVDVSRIEQALVRYDIALHEKIGTMLSGQP